MNNEYKMTEEFKSHIAYQLTMIGETCFYENATFVSVLRRADGSFEWNCLEDFGGEVEDGGIIDVESVSEALEEIIQMVR